MTTPLDDNTNDQNLFKTGLFSDKALEIIGFLKKHQFPSDFNYNNRINPLHKTFMRGKIKRSKEGEVILDMANYFCAYRPSAHSDKVKDNFAASLKTVVLRWKPTFDKFSEDVCLYIEGVIPVKCNEIGVILAVLTGKNLDKFPKKTVNSIVGSSRDPMSTMKSKVFKENIEKFKEELCQKRKEASDLHDKMDEEALKEFKKKVYDLATSLEIDESRFDVEFGLKFFQPIPKPAF